MTMLRAERLELRRFAPEDLPAYAAIRAHPAVARWLPRHWPSGRSSWLPLRGGARRDRDPVDHRSGRAGPWLRHRSGDRRRDWAFGTRRLDQVIGIAVPENGASRRVKEKAGLQPAGETEFHPMRVLR
jgi:RimJ/RimL family protein N-acetyltransferase